METERTEWEVRDIPGAGVGVAATFPRVDAQEESCHLSDKAKWKMNSVESSRRPLNKQRTCFPHRKVNRHSRNPDNGEKQTPAP